MNLTRRQFNLSVNSNDPGNQNVSADGSSFEVYLNQGLHIPYKAQNVQLTCERATFWWTTPNITTGDNDTITVVDRRRRGADGVVLSPVVEEPNDLNSDTSSNHKTYTITLQPGLYNVDTLDSYINTRIKSESGENERLFRIQGNTSTSFVELTTVAPFITINLEEGRLHTLLGFEPIQYRAVTSGTLFSGTTRASFSPTDYVLMQCSLADAGLRIGNIQDNIIAKVLIDKKVGSQVAYVPERPPVMSCDMLVNQTTRVIRFAIKKDDLSPYDTAGNYWSVDVRIAWYE